MQPGTDGPNNTLNELVRIGVKFYSQMSARRICLQQDNRRRRVWRQSGQVSAAMWWFPHVLWWHYVGRRTPLVVMEGAETAIRYRNDILRRTVQPYRQNFGGIRLNGRQFSPSSCTSCE